MSEEDDSQYEDDKGEVDDEEHVEININEGTEDNDNEDRENERSESEEDSNEPTYQLTEQMAGESLSLLCKIGNGLSHAYVKMDLVNKALNDISIICAFIHVRYLDLSDNKLSSITPIASLKHLLTLKVDNNNLKSIDIPPMPYLQKASFQNNKLVTIKGIAHPMLEVLNLNSNKIVEANFDISGLPKLSVLELRENRLKSTKGLGFPKLQRLYLAENKITSLTDIDQCVSLKILHLRGDNEAQTNPIESLDGLSKSMVALQYLNLRGTNVSSLKTELPKLKQLPILRGLVLKDSPVAREDEYRIEVIMNLRNLERLDKDVFTDEEKEEAQNLFREREEEGGLDDNSVAEGAVVLE